MNAIQTEKAPAAIGPYSQAIDSGIAVKTLPKGALVEVECIAAINPQGR